MEWMSHNAKLEVAKEEMIGNKRVIRKFLYFPKSLENKTKWWEYVYIEQCYHCFYDGGPHGDGWIRGYFDEKFVEIQESNKVKTYLAKPIVQTKEYKTMGEVLPLLDAGTHKVKVQEGDTVVGKLKLKEEDCLIDGKVVRVKKGKIKKKYNFSWTLEPRNISSQVLTWVGVISVVIAFVYGSPMTLIVAIGMLGIVYCQLKRIGFNNVN